MEAGAEEKLAKTLHPLERRLLPFLSDGGSIESLTANSGMKDVEVMRAVQWLSNKGIIKLTEIEQATITLGTNGKDYALAGLPERRFINAIQHGRMRMDELASKTQMSRDELNACIGILRGKAAIEISKEAELSFSLTEQGKKLLSKETFEEEFLKNGFPVMLAGLKDEEKLAFENLRKRKDILILNNIKVRSIELTDLGRRLSKVKMADGKTIERVTSDIIRKQEWKTSSFRHYDVSINVPQISGGKRHFVNQAVDYVRRIWLDMGFVEVTGPLVETSFWDLDALFVPQDHPARQMQDSFFIKEPKYGKLPSFYRRVKETHENGADTGSKGWGGKWSEETAKENLLITHDTYLSAITLSKLKKEDLPFKSFQIMKVFRNEALDYKHLFEFHQVGGIVVDENANFSNLLGYLRAFFKKMGFLDVRIRPAHFPYTEPSAEVEVLHPIHKEWMELGGSGIFRPEMVTPLIGFDVPVLAWGLGLGRIISEYWNIHDIRDLDRNDIKQLREAKFWMK